MSEKHVGAVKVHINGQVVGKDVFCAGWRGSIYTKWKGDYHAATRALYANGACGSDHSWSDLILFDPWQRVADHRVMRVIHLVEATKQRLGVTT